jgi:hypothetical protein
MSSAKKTGCEACIDSCEPLGVSFECRADGFPRNNETCYGPNPDCDYAIKGKHNDWCKFLWKWGNDTSYDAACHCAEAKLQALDIFYKETMKTILRARYKLVAGIVRRRTK